MTFPSVVGATGYVQNSATTSWAVFSGVTVRRGSIIVVSAGGDGTAVLSTASAGWVKVGQVDDTSGSFTGSSALFKATVDNTAFTVAVTASRKLSAILFRATGGGTVSGTATADTINPPTHSIGATHDVLWVEAMSSADDNVASSASSGYSGLTTATSDGSTGSASTSLAYRTNRASSEDPGPMAAPSTARCTAAWTIALYNGRRKIRAGGTL